MIQPIALKLDIQILSDSLELTIAQLISVQQQESLSEQSKRSICATAKSNCHTTTGKVV
ncbi:hypothetical protein [Leuconostoc mesenteroides]|uniref:hypothetical protein n=1 Tax=Leuconostoc mesenteroides TaxID=1245 RepID=UPI001FA8ABA7|nr:hypothetical protein [Leuconostoc mesenteroides]